MNLDDLKSISDFDKYEQFIRQFIVTNSNLWKLIFYPYSDPFNDERSIDPEDPYRIFTRDTTNSKNGTILDSHGVVLFQDKDDTIQNSTNTIILISFESTRLGNSQLMDNNYIIFQVICKGNDIRKLANDKDRTEAIVEFIDSEFNLARIHDFGEIKRMSYKKLSLNEQNIGHVVVYKCRNLSNHILDNKNYLKRTYGVDSSEYL